MAWHYRGMEGADGVYSIRGVFIDENGEVEKFTLEPLAPLGDSKNDLVADLANMLNALTTHDPLIEGDYMEGTPIEMIAADDADEQLH